MALAPPRLDDRGYTDLRAELIRRIPVHSPEWTDYNATDPGITLIELFSFLGDNLLYRLNRAPEAAKLAFLQLLNIPPRPAQVALAQVRLDLQKGVADPVTPDFAPTAPRIQLAAGSVLFQPTEEITALPVELSAWIKQPYTGETPPEGVEPVKQLLEDHLGSVPDLSTYLPTQLPAPKGGALPPAASTAGAVDDSFWLCLAAPDAVMKALDTGDPVATLDLVRQKIAGHVINIGFRTDDALCGPADVLRCPDPGTDPSRWPVRYDISTGRFAGAAKRVDQIVYQRLVVAADTTNSIGQTGTVRLRLPDRNGDGSLPFGDWTADSFDPSDPDLLGVGGLPPRLDDPKLAARVLAWIRVQRIDPTHPPIGVRLIDANMVSAEQAVTAAPELLGNGTGRAGQTLKFSKSPVIQGSEVIQVRAASGWENWTRVDDLALAGPDDPFYALDPIAGTVTFGDGVHGRMPLPGEAIRVLGYRYGGGVAGNVGAGGISRVRGASLQAIEPAASRRRPGRRDHGAGAGPHPAGAARARPCGVQRGLLHNRAGDARRAGGPRRGAASAQAARAGGRHTRRGHPDRAARLRCDAGHADAGPRDAAQGLRLAGAAATGDHRALRDPARVRAVDIAVAVQPDAGTGEETLRRWVELALRQYFAPLPPYGPDGAGWPFGRAVRDRDAEAAALHVQGVQLVNDVMVQGTTDRRGRHADRRHRHRGDAGMAAAGGAAGGGCDRHHGPGARPEPPPPANGIPVPVTQGKC